MEELVKDSMTCQEIRQSLEQFNKGYINPLSRISLDVEDQIKMWRDLWRLMRNPERKECLETVLATVKIFTRNTDVMDKVIDAAELDYLLVLAGLTINDDKSLSVRMDKVNRNFNVIEEALKCLSNIFFQCGKSLGLSVTHAPLPALMYHVKLYKELDIPSSVIVFDLRLLFLLTAQLPLARRLVLEEHGGIHCLLDPLLEVIERAKNRCSHNSGCFNLKLREIEVQVLSYALKVLFNCTCDFNVSISAGRHASNIHAFDVEGYVLSDLVKLCKIIHLLITVDKEEYSLQLTVVSNCINLLSNYPENCTNNLMLPLDRNYIGNADEREIKYNGVCMNAPRAILNFLLATIDNKCSRDSTLCSLRDAITPALKVLCTLSYEHRLIRKYLRWIVLPPITDLSKRPEEGDSPRSKLCRLLTSPESSVSLMVADFLFILCKENVKRMVKHTGYGNAAGLLARRGLMKGAGGSGHYSQTDEDSDTEEYTRNAHKVNPISGYVEPSKPSPLAGMSEEQKEHEAVKLANLIGRLHSMGLVKPAKLDEGGKPTPVDHILELVENPSGNDLLTGQQHLRGSQDGDSD